jgi:hypothetical protein
MNAGKVQALLANSEPMTWHSLHAWLQLWAAIERQPPDRSRDEIEWACWIAAHPVAAPRWME